MATGVSGDVPSTMRAYRLLEWQQPPEFVEVPVPLPAPGQVLLRVRGVGLCHSDMLFMDEPEGRFPYKVPFTLGHEIGGEVVAVGNPHGRWQPGDNVLVASLNPCGACAYCLKGWDNYCQSTPTGHGSGLDGGLAEYVLVGAGSLVKLPTLDPCEASPLTDAGKTSYHAVKMALSRMVPGSTTVVIGLGGLGGYAVQYVQLLSRSRLIATDVAEHRLAAARELGVEELVLSDAGVTDALKEKTGGQGADVVFDFVGSDETIATALALSRPMGLVVILGAAGGTARISWTTVARECPVLIPQGGTLTDLAEVVALAETGVLQMHNEVFGFDRTPEAYARVRANTLAGRAVVAPDR
jgi:propanol-preferring alcohol dehydrogenase